MSAEPLHPSEYSILLRDRRSRLEIGKYYLFIIVDTLAPRGRPEEEEFVGKFMGYDSTRYMYKLQPVGSENVIEYEDYAVFSVYTTPEAYLKPFRNARWGKRKHAIAGWTGHYGGTRKQRSKRQRKSTHRRK